MKPKQDFSVWPIRLCQLSLAVSVKPFWSGPFRSRDSLVGMFRSDFIRQNEISPKQSVPSRFQKKRKKETVT